MSQSYSFSNFYYKGINIDGSCESWISLVDNSLALSFSDVDFFLSKISLDFVIDTFAVNAQSTTATCADPAIITKLVSNLRLRRSYQVNCNDYSWRVFSCGSSPVLCVNCKENCVKTVSCPGTSNIVNPCYSDCKERIAAGSNVHFEYTMRAFYPILSNITVISKTQSSITVSVGVSTAGNVYCAAFATGTVLTSVLSIKGAGVSALNPVPASAVLFLTMTGLDVDTSYDVYCYSEDFKSHAMPLAAAIQTKRKVTTACCRAVTLLTSYTSILQYFPSTVVADEDVFRFSINARPASTLSVSLSSKPVACAGSSSAATATNATVLPSSVTFYPGSSSLQSTFIVRSYDPGCFRIFAIATGAQTYTGFSALITVRNVRVPPSAPTVSSAVYSYEGTKIFIKFDSNTNSADTVLSNPNAPFNCTKLLSFTTVDRSTCQWLSATQLAISSVKLNTLPPVGANITLLANVVRAKCVSIQSCAAYPFITQTTVVIVAPLLAIKPVVSIASATAVGSCDSIMLDPQSSTGSAGRAWTTLKWSVVSTHGINDSDISTFLSANYRTTTGVATVPNKYLYPNRVYTFSLSLTNFLGQTGVGSVTVNTSAVGVTMPHVRIIGPTTPLYRWMEVNLYALSVLPVCVGQTNIVTTYVWRAFSEQVFVSSLVSTSLDGRYFKLSPYTLIPGAVYTIQVTATARFAGTSVPAVASYTLAVGVSGVTAVIAGSSQVTSVVSRAVTFDASGSSDIDYPTSRALSYAWGCATISPSFGESCGTYLPDVTSQSTITLEANMLPAGVYNITVTVSNALKASAAASVQLTVTNRVVPAISIATPMIKYNADSKVILIGSVVAIASTAQATWICASITKLAQIAGSSTSKAIVRGAPTFQLSLHPSKLTAGSSYTFTLSAHYVGSTDTASATVTVVMNSAPSSGAVTVSPSTGTALLTQFLITTSMWTDDVADLPLRYVLSYYTLSSADPIAIKAEDYVTYATTLLGQGLLSLNYRNTIVATAMDIYNGSANATTTAFVWGVSVNAQMSASTNTALNFAIADRNPTAVNQIVACTRNSTCASGSCVAGRCGDISKSCPNSCSNQGKCVFVNSAKEVVSSCSIADPLCSARCECIGGSYGQDCTLSLSKLQQLQNLREALCRSMAATLNQQEVSLDVINSRAVTVAELVADMTQVNENAFLFCTAVIVDTVTDHPNLACVGSSAFLISTALSNILQRARVSNLESALMVNITRAVNVVSASCVESLAIGDAPVSIVTTNLRISAVVTSQEALASGIHLTIAQSPIEALSGAPAAASRVGATGVAEGDAVGMSLVQYNNNPLNAYINTTALSVHTTAVSHPLTSRRRLIESDLEAGEYIVLQNKKAINYIAFHPSEMQVKCITPLTEASYPVRGMCPSGFPYTVECPARVKGNFNITCNGVKTQPTCTSFDGTSFVRDTRCEVTSYTSTNTTCFCRLEAKVQSRSEVKTYAATMSLTAIPFLSTFVELPLLQEPAQTKALFSSMGVILGLLVVGLLAFGAWDRKRNKMPKLTDKKETLSTDRTILSFYNSLLPDVFRNSKDSLRSLLGKALWEHHTWLRVINEFSRLDARSLSGSAPSTLAATGTDHRFVEFWVVTLGKLLTFFFFNSFLATVVYPYEASCADFTAHVVCEDQKSYLGLYQTCEWSERSESCGYRGPQLRILHILVYAAMVIAASIVYNRMLDWIFRSAFSALHDADLRAWLPLKTLWWPPVHAELLVENALDADEFQEYESVQLRVLLAARIAKSDNVLTYATAEDETRFIASVRQVDKDEMRNNRIEKSKWYFNRPQELTPYDRRCPRATKHDKIKKYVTRARTQGLRLYQHLQTHQKSEDQERLLMAMFCIDSLPFSVQSVAAHAMLPDDDLWALFYPFCMAPAGSKKVLAVVLAVAHFVVQITLLGLWDRYIVSSNAALWGCVLLTVLVQYYLVHECAVIFLKKVLIEQMIVARKAPLLLFAFVPYCVGELLTDLFVMVFVSAAVFGLYFLGVYYPTVGISVASGMVGLPLSYELFLRYRVWRKREVSVTTENDFAMDKFYFNDDSACDYYATDNDTPTTPGKELSGKPNNFGPSTGASKYFLSGKHLSSKYAESTRMVAGASASTPGLPRVVVGPPIPFKPDGHTSEITFTTKPTGTPPLLRKSSIAREVRVAPAVTPPISLYACEDDRFNDTFDHHEPLAYGTAHSRGSRWRFQSEHRDPPSPGKSPTASRSEARWSPQRSRRHEILFEDKKVSSLTSPPDEFLYKLGLLNKLRRRRESVARALLKPPTDNSATGGASSAANEKSFVTLCDTRRQTKIRHSSPATAQRLRERHRAASEAHPPGADTIHETKGTTPYMFPSWDSPSKYAHVMLVAADA
eukprot:gene12973-14967_t